MADDQSNPILSYIVALILSVAFIVSLATFTVIKLHTPQAKNEIGHESDVQMDVVLKGRKDNKLTQAIIEAPSYDCLP